MFTIVLLVSIIICCIYLNDRNTKVRDYRLNILNCIFNKSCTNWNKRINLLKEFEKITYEEMLYKFWKPIDSFYSKDFLDKLL